MCRDAWSVARLLRADAAGAVVLLSASAVALLWANSPWSASYVSLWSTPVHLGGVAVDLGRWVDDGLMTLFFFVIGLEIKRELVVGRLSSARAAALPVVAALGGMIVPAALYLAVNAGGDGRVGWGIPMATDVAFAVGVLTLLGERAPPGLRVLLLALAIVDDIGAIVVIALVYGEAVEPAWLAVSATGLLVVVVLRRVGVGSIPVYVAVGAGIWFAVLQSGVHATIAGVALALLTPARAAGHERRSVAEGLQAVLAPWVSFVVLPVFALANAGVAIGGGALADAASSPVTIGIVIGLVAGKFLGVAGAVALAVRFGPARLPDGVAWRHVLGMAALAGIGFTVSLFVADLAFEDPLLLDQAKLGILVASSLAAGTGLMVLRRGSRAVRRVGQPVGGG